MKFLWKIKNTFVLFAFVFGCAYSVSLHAKSGKTTGGLLVAECPLNRLEDMSKPGDGHYYPGGNLKIYRENGQYRVDHRGKSYTAQKKFVYGIDGKSPRKLKNLWRIVYQAVDSEFHLIFHSYGPWKVYNVSVHHYRGWEYKVLKSNKCRAKNGYKGLRPLDKNEVVQFEKTIKRMSLNYFDKSDQREYHRIKSDSDYIYLKQKLSKEKAF